MSPAPGNEPQEEAQVEKGSTLSLVRRDTALLLRDMRQGASNWIRSLLDSNAATPAPAAAGEKPPGAAGKNRRACSSAAFFGALLCAHVFSSFYYNISCI